VQLLESIRVQVSNSLCSNNNTIAALSVGVGVMLIAGFASPTHPSLANAVN
jgi:hypothetical protein